MYMQAQNKNWAAINIDSSDDYSHSLNVSNDDGDQIPIQIFHKVYFFFISRPQEPWGIENIETDVVQHVETSEDIEDQQVRDAYTVDSALREDDMNKR